MSARRLTRRELLKTTGLLTITAPIAAACVAPPAAPSAETATTTAPETQPTTAPAPAAGKVTVTFLSPFNENIERDQWLPRTQAFTEANSNIEIATETGAGTAYTEKYLAAVAAGTPIDIGWGGGVFFHMINAGKLVILDPLIERDKVERNQFIPGIIDGQMTFDGQTLGLPQQNDTMALWINQKLLDEVGVKLPGFDWTWEDFLPIATALTKRSGDQVTQWGYTLGFFDPTFFWRDLLLQRNGDDLNAERNQWIGNSPEGVEAAQYIMDLMQKEKVTPVPGAAFENGFEAGKEGMSYNGDWMFARYVNELKMPLSTMPLPVNKATGMQSVFGFAAPFFIATSTPEKEDAAWKFISWFLSKDENLSWSLDTGYLPTRLDVFDDPKYKEYLQGTGKPLAAWTHSLSNGKSVASIGLTAFAKMGDITKEELQAAFLGQKTAKQAMDDAAARINADPENFKPTKLPG